MSIPSDRRAGWIAIFVEKWEDAGFAIGDHAKQKGGGSYR